MKFARFSRAVAGLLGSVFFVSLFSCQAINARVSTLWTDSADIAGYVETFNASQGQWQILVDYKADLAHELASGRVKADLLVGRYIDSRSLRSSLTSLSFVFERGGVTKSMFYPGLLALGSDGDTPLLLPLSFDLPILVFKEGSPAGKDGIYLSFADARSNGKIFNESAPSGFHRFAFSPRWNNFGLTALAALGVPFQEDFRGRLTWNQDRLGSALEFLTSWIQDKGKGQDEREFSLKYEQGNPLQLVQDGHVLYANSTLRDFLTLPDEERRGLDFRYAQASDGVPVQDDILWAAVPSSALTRSAAQAFLSWYFQFSTQSALVKTTHEVYFRRFGIAGGLDSLIRVNQEVLPEYFPELAGRLPAGPSLSFPPVRPWDWRDLKTKVLEPWIESRLAEKSTLSLDAVLDQRYHDTTPR